jgi:hypothetical protein
MLSYGGSAARYLISTLLDPLPKSPERTYRFIGGNYSWTAIFETLEKVQGVKYEVVYTDVKEARTKQQQVRPTNFLHWRRNVDHYIRQLKLEMSMQSYRHLIKSFRAQDALWFRRHMTIIDFQM